MGLCMAHAMGNRRGQAEFNFVKSIKICRNVCYLLFAFQYLIVSLLISQILRIHTLAFAFIYIIFSIEFDKLVATAYNVEETNLI